MLVPAEFVLSATRAEQFPLEDLPEIAFLGRSNVGKSSLLNSLLGQKLAFTSSTPGRTQAVNFYRVQTAAAAVMFVDLPGYGYAEVSRSERQHWKALVESYLFGRAALQLGVLLIDSRRAWMESDLLLKDWLDGHQRRYVVVATKVDKLNQKEKNQSLRAIRQHFPEMPVCFSAVTGQGVKELWQAIKKTIK